MAHGSFLIAGGGIAGLAGALAVARAGYAATVIEQASCFEEVPMYSVILMAALTTSSATPDFGRRGGCHSRCHGCSGSCGGGCSGCWGGGYGCCGGGYAQSGSFPFSITSTDSAVDLPYVELLQCRKD